MTGKTQWTNLTEIPVASGISGEQTTGIQGKRSPASLLALYVQTYLMTIVRDKVKA